MSVDLTRFGLKGQDLPTIVAATAGVDARLALLVLAALVAGGLLVFVFSDARFRAKPDQMVAGVLIGLIVTAAWYLLVLARGAVGAGRGLIQVNGRGAAARNACCSFAVCCPAHCA